MSCASKKSPKQHVVFIFVGTAVSRSRMKDVPVANLCRNFLHQSLAEGKRPEGGRQLREKRDLAITFGSEPGSCFATLGETKVLAQVSCSVVEPRATRPNEGQLMIQVDFLPTCAPRFAEGSVGNSATEEEVTEVTRLLERLLKESRCLDMESLCIIAEEKVWCIRLDIHVLNHEGNVADCAGVAGLAALSHFKRPDATVEDSLVKIHSVHERDPIPLAVHHFPVCSTFAFFKPPGASDVVVVCDPNHQEEAVMDGKLVLGINPYREICTLHLAGHMLIDKGLVLSLANSAVDFAKDTVNKIKSALTLDQEKRKDGKSLGLSTMLRPESINHRAKDAQEIEISKLDIKNDSETVEDDKKAIIKQDGDVVEMVSDEEEEIVEIEPPKKPKLSEPTMDEGDDSEEECTTTLSGSQNIEAAKN